MDFVIKANVFHISQALSPISSSTPESTIFGKPSHSSNPDTSFPIIAIAVIGILATAFLLVSYYIFVIKCCLNWHRIDLLRRYSLSTRRREQLMAYSPGIQKNGLDESVIRSIPVLQFKKEKGKDLEKGKSFSECAVCLNEFKEDEKLRIIPICGHLFHIDCVDVWLQNNANCPLCRAVISSNQIHVDSSPYRIENLSSDEDFVVIELGNNDFLADQTAVVRQERLNINSGEATARRLMGTPSPKKLEQRSNYVGKKSRTLNKVTSMGDECIDIRQKDEQFAVQPIRRSFSMDSSADRKLYLAIQEALPEQKNGMLQVCNGEISSNINIEDCSSSRIRRSFFSFGHGRSGGSRSSSVLPVYLEP